MNKIIYHSVCLCTIFLTGVSGDIDQKPLNGATGIGGQNVFNCSSNITSGAIMTWLSSTDCISDHGVALTVSNCALKDSYAANYKIEKPNEFTCNLIVYDAVLSLGGCYICNDGPGQGRSASAFLIIVDSIASITSNSTDIIPGEDVMINSTVLYSGPMLSLPPLPPSFYWTPESDPSQNITSYQGLTTNTSASSHIVVTAQKPVVPPYLCNLFFNPPTVPSGWASNAPTYRTSWKSQPNDVQYPPENLNITEVNDGCPYNGPVVLTCSAAGHPTPTYEWFDLTNKRNLPKSGIVSIDYPGTYQCVATNTIRGVLHTESISVNVSDCFAYVPELHNNSCEIGCIIAVVLGIYFGLGLLFFVVFMFCYGSKNGRIKLNDRFSWLEKMLPCMNNKGCECSVWIFYFVLMSIFVAFFVFPVMLIMASCCKKKTKTSQVNSRNMPLSERNGRGVGGAQVIISGQPTNQYPPRMSVTPNPPSSLDTSILSLPEHPMHRPYPHSSDQQRQPTQWGNSADPYHQVPRNIQLPRHTPSPALSSGAIIYADLGVDNQPKSRRPIQPIQNEGNPYADIAIA